MNLPVAEPNTGTVPFSPETDLLELCFDRGWTDGLPVIPPTRERVTAMIQAADPDEVVAVLPPSGAVATRRLVAANAVMAGCLPSYLPVVEAAVRAVARPEFNLDRVLTTASSQSPAVVVNGPIANTLELGGNAEALGSQSRAPATIGRAMMLVLKNLAAYGESGVEHSTLGNPARRGLCFTESVAHSPWPSWHHERGADSDTSWVSVFPAESPLTIVDMGHDSPEAVLRTICESISIPGTYNAFFRQDMWLVLSPQHAMTFARGGWSRTDVAAAVQEHANLPSDQLRGRGLYGYIDELLPPDWLDNDPVPIIENANGLAIFVAGAEFGGYTAALFGEGHTVTEQVTVQ